MSGRTNVELKLRLSAEVKSQLETLAAERGSTVSETVAALVALAYWRDDGQAAAELPAREVRAALKKARRAALARPRPRSEAK
jgi:hypothetical protein